MKISFSTLLHHEHNESGSVRSTHCCGCWDFVINDNAPHKPYAQCNECGEIRVATFGGIIA